MRPSKSSLTRLIVSAIFFSFILVPILPKTSYAEIFPRSYWTREKTYMDKISHKLGFGVLNLTAGWTALFYEPYYEGWKGLGTGLLYTVTNTAGGAIHAVTFPIPLDVPLPQGGIAYEYER
jgi:hypothetical protein